MSDQQVRKEILDKLESDLNSWAKRLSERLNEMNKREGNLKLHVYPTLSVSWEIKS